MPDFLNGDPWDVYYESIQHRFLPPRIDVTDSETPSSVGIDLWDHFYKSLGYLPHLDESTLELLKELLPEEYGSDIAKITRRINPADRSNFLSGLSARNVVFERFSDAFVDYVKSLSPEVPEETLQEKEHEARAWELDLRKVSNDSLEAIFQRTILMSMINRHRLIYGQRDAIIDFAVEKPWACPPMPTRQFINADPKSLSQPKADLALAFHHRAIFQERYWDYLPLALRNMVCYEGNETISQSRIFHFMTIESKSSLKNINDPTGIL